MRYGGDVPDGARRALPWRVADAGVRAVLPLGIFAAVLAVFFGERARIDHELQLVAPVEVEPESRVALRAFAFERLNAVDGPHLASLPVTVRLLDEGGRALARVELGPSVAGGAEGTLALPSGLSGGVSLEAVAWAEGEPVASARTPLRVRASLAPPELVGRLRTELQELALGPWTPPQAAVGVQVRVEGAACVPEHPCRLLVRPSEPGLGVSLEPSASATPGAVEGGAELLALTVVVHGPEARTELVARREGRELARRSIQLPVALATPGVTLRRRLLDPDEPVRLRAAVLGDRPGVVVDAHREGRWARTLSFPPADEERALALDLEPGLWRVQVHTDPYASERSAVRLLWVRTPDQDDHAALTAAAAALGEPLPPPGAADLRLAWLASPGEDSVESLPAPRSGLDEDLARLAARQARLRSMAGVALMLGLVVAAVLFLRRGVEAALQAQGVMDATGDPELTSRRHRRRTLLSALALVATAMLAFLGAAALVVARAHLFG